jgi:hypothetical protein
MFGLNDCYCPLLPTIGAIIARVKPLFTTFMIQMIYEYELNVILSNYLGNVQELWIDI